MPLNIIDGSRINYHQGLDTAHVHEWQLDCYDLGEGDDQIFWDMGMPAVLGDWWILSSITIAFTVQPVAPGMLWVDADAGADIYWMTYVGQTPAVVGQTDCCPGNSGPYKFNFRPAIKFPADTDFAINFWGTDGLTTFAISWECWQENDVAEV